jgi:hypothetical protein
MQRPLRFAALAVILSAIAIAGVPASADGSWTKVTSQNGPGKPFFQYFDGIATPSPTINISGRTSSDVSQVNFYCFYDGDRKATTSSPLNGVAVNVTSGAFSATGVAAPWSQTPCVLRAVPATFTGVDGSGNNNSYVASFAGPTFFTGSHSQFAGTSGKLTRFATSTVHPRTFNELSSASYFGVGTMYPIDSVTNTIGQTDLDGDLNIEDQNVVKSGGTPTRSGLVIDGHNVYFPNELDSLADSPAHVPAMTVTSKRVSGGELVVHESDPLRYCSGNAYPQTAGSCVPVAVGVTFTRTYRTSHSGAVLLVADRLVDVAHRRHSFNLQYFNFIGGPGGDAGIMLPGWPAFRIAPTDRSVSTPVRPHTIYTTSDFRAADGDPNRADTAFTYSGHPGVYFAGAGEHALKYARAIPKNGFAAVTFALETASSMTTTRSLAGLEQKALTPRLVLTRPTATTADNTPTIRGRLANATNGFPAKAKVTIGARSRTVSVNQSTGAFAVTWPSLTNGKHTVRVSVTDPSGMVLRAARTVKVT